MPEFPKPPPRPGSSGSPSSSPSAPGLGGVTLRPEPAAILRACGRVGPLFMLTRNPACIFGAVADPLRTLDRWDGPLVASGAITLNLRRRREVTAYGYLEAGPRGGFIDAIEFCAPGGVGFLKLCRMDETSRERWLGLLAEFQTGGVAPAGIAGLQKTNHLNVAGTPGGAPSPAEAVLARFFDLVGQCRAEMHVTAPMGGGRARLAIAPTHRVRAGEWMVLSSDETAWHLAPGLVRELRVIRRPHLALLVLLGGPGDRGRLLARVLVRDRALLAQLPEIL